MVAELRNEKIDVIRFSADPVDYISNALSPARITTVALYDDSAESAGKRAEVIVPDDQLSLAIGRGGQNVRLAAKLTSWKIDIKSESQAEGSFRSNEQASPSSGRPLNRNVESATEQGQKSLGNSAADKGKGDSSEQSIGAFEDSNAPA